MSDNIVKGRFEYSGVNPTHGIPHLPFSRSHLKNESFILIPPPTGGGRTTNFEKISEVGVNVLYYKIQLNFIVKGNFPPHPNPLPSSREREFLFLTNSQKENNATKKITLFFIFFLQIMYNLNMKNIKAFTLIELLVVILIIAVLASIALPKYMIARDKAHLAGLMTLGKNVNDALDRRSLFDSTADNSALDLIDISFKKYDGSDCTGGSNCRITVSGKDYSIGARLNYGSILGSNYSVLYSYENTAFHVLTVYTETREPDYTYLLHCYQLNGSYIDPDRTRCVKVGKSLGAVNAECVDSGNAYCYFN